MLCMLWFSEFETAYFLREQRSAIPAHCLSPAAGLTWPQLPILPSGLALIVGQLLAPLQEIYHPWVVTLTLSKTLWEHHQVPVPSDSAWWNIATVTNTLGSHQPATLQEPRLSRNDAGWPRNRAAAAKAIQLPVILAHLEAGRASVPPMSSGFSLALSRCLLIHIHPFVREPEFLINLITAVIQRKLLHPKSVASES